MLQVIPKWPPLQLIKIYFKYIIVGGYYLVTYMDEASHSIVSYTHIVALLIITKLLT